VLLLSGCAKTASPTREPRPVPEPLGAVSLTSEHGYLDDYGLPTALVKVGTSAPLRLLVDTGSVGLRVIESDLSVTARETMLCEQRVETTATFDDGLKLTGVEAEAKFEIGGLTTASLVPLQLVQSISCLAEMPCPSNYYRVNGKGSGLEGVLGIGLAPSNVGLPNVLEDLPGRYGNSWSIHMVRGKGGELLLGAFSTPSTMSVIHLRRKVEPGDEPDTWDDSPSLCWAVGNQSFCGVPSFDSGSNFSTFANNTALRLSKYHAPPFGSHAKVLNAGIRVSLHYLSQVENFGLFSLVTSPATTK